MTSNDLRLRILRVQLQLERHDAHHADCNCNFCDAIVELALIRHDLKRIEAAS